MRGLYREMKLHTAMQASDCRLLELEGTLCHIVPKTQIYCPGNQFPAMVDKCHGFIDNGDNCSGGQAYRWCGQAGL